MSALRGITKPTAERSQDVDSRPDIEISDRQATVRVHAALIVTEPAMRFRLLYCVDRFVQAADFENAEQGLGGQDPGPVGRIRVSGS